MNDKDILAAIQPSISRGGEMTILSTPRGRANQFWEIWEDKSRAFSQHKAPWWICPDPMYRKMVKRIQKSMIDLDFRQEYCCFAPGTLVHCIDGYKPIEEITTDDLVLTHKGRFRNVLKTLSRKYSGKLCRIRSYHNLHFPMLVTPEHPILTESGFKKASEISEDDRISYIHPEHVNKITIFKRDDFVDKYNYGFRSKWLKFVPEKFKFDAELAELCGWYLAEGSTGSKMRQVAFSLGYTEMEHALRIQHLLKKVFCVDSKIRERGSALNVICNCKILANFFKQFGPNSREKFLPEFVKNSTISVKSAFLKAYTNGDGWEDEKHYSIATASLRLALDVNNLCLQLGYTPSIKKAMHTFSFDMRTPQERPIYQISFSKNKDDAGKKFKNNASGRSFRVRDCDVTDYDGVVYNLEVEEDNTYSVINATVHNCDPCELDLAFFTRALLDPVINPDARYVESMETKNHVVMGIDFGKKVSSTVITVAEREDDMVYIRRQEELRHMPYDYNLPGETQLKRVAYLDRALDVDEINIDATGVGVRLEEDMRRIFGAKVNPVIFTNKDKEIMITNLRLLCEKRGIELVDDAEFISQLLSLERDYTPSGMVSYKHVKGKRDDRVWSACLAVKDMLSPDTSLDCEFGDTSFAKKLHDHLDAGREYELSESRIENIISPW